MKEVKKLRIVIDIAMTLGLLACMSYLLIGEEFHEWIGTGMFLLYGLHLTLNRKWFCALPRGKYSALRFMQTTINLLLIVVMVAQACSGVVLSRFVFVSLPITGGTSLARIIHMLCAYWGFVLMSLHLGLHWSIVVSRLKNKLTKSWQMTLLSVITMIIALYGIFAFIEHNLISYMLLQNRYVFFDLERGILLFYIDYIAMMILWACVTYYIKLILNKQQKIERSA